MFVKIDKSVKITYEPFMFQEGAISQTSKENTWGYHLKIENIGTSHLVMTSNYWQIPNLQGDFDKIEEDNIKDIELHPGDICEIIGYPPLQEKGTLVIGSYTMKDENGEEFDLHVPFFNPHHLPISKTLH